MTREEAIKTLRELWRETHDSWYEEAYDMAIEALSAEAETKCVAQITFDEDKLREIVHEEVERIKEECDITDGWILVSERLPNEDGRYLVIYPLFMRKDNWINILRYGEPLMPNVEVKGKHFYDCDSEWGDIVYDEVVAWMPLPTPYREENEA